GTPRRTWLSSRNRRHRTGNGRSDCGAGTRTPISRSRAARIAHYSTPHCGITLASCFGREFPFRPTPKRTYVRMNSIDWEEVRSYYGAGHSVRESCERFGLTARAWQRAVGQGLVPKPSPPALRPSEKQALIDQLMAAGYTQNMIAAELG